jgi:hypothetical protein
LIGVSLFSRGPGRLSYSILDAVTLGYDESSLLKQGPLDIELIPEVEWEDALKLWNRLWNLDFTQESIL